nr:MAG: ORF1 [Hubei mosquito virus 4]QRW42176.1 MAG: ORF1 [Hubei mosquito virus 4]
MSQHGARGQPRGAGRPTPTSGHRGKDGSKEPKGDDRQHNPRSAKGKPSGNARGPQWQTVGRKPRAANPEALLRRIHALEQANKNLLFQLGRVNAGASGSGSTSRGSTSGRTNPAPPVRPKPAPRTKAPAPAPRTKAPAPPQGPKGPRKPPARGPGNRTVSSSHLPAAGTKNSFQLLGEEFPHLSRGTLALAVSAGLSGVCTPTATIANGVPAEASTGEHSPRSTRRANSSPELSVRRPAPRAEGRRRSPASKTNSTPTQGSSSQHRAATAEPKVAPNPAGSDRVPQPRLRMKPGDHGWKGAGPPGVFHSPTVVSPRSAGVCLEVSAKKGELVENTNPVFVHKATLRRDVECGVGTTRANLAKLLSTKEVSMAELYKDATVPMSSWKDTFGITIDAAKSLVVDEFLYYELVSRFPFAVRTTDLARKMFHHLNTVLAQYDCRLYTAKELYKLKQATVRAALLPPAEELLTRKLIQQEASQMEKYNKFADKGDAGSVCRPGSATASAFSSLLQSRVGLRPTPK